MTAFLTRFEINPARRQARNLLGSPHRLHAAVLAAFPDAHRSPTAAGRVLWRLDQDEHRTVLYLVSPSAPDLTHLVEQAGWPTTHGWDTRDYTPLLDRLRAGARYAFRLTANPARSQRRKPTDTRSQRYAHVTAAQQTQWLLDRVAGHGATICDGFDKEPDLAVRDRRTWRFPRAGNTVTLATAAFEGRLEVTDPAALRAALVSGIGPAKGYGCGLLTLAPAR
ncbi:type I-E CRISPR-associated protein Cas6/Cse3/CasE [Actinokineospora cianjurensis]|uniref:CRISPR-associated Cse3 family protein n=1 Tax=Actinokineospora cianjurensis TaxID=585224 RepID=A0A421B2R6_9PSEU|nr:type I-E CRISPR-associated protein Cas6/Cse3/CasE [Actinokineospora cianjurensis]RLK58702.1 CRISPR-associated Cse3 family protein [Actinokineospora cianjurensis]